MKISYKNNVAKLMLEHRKSARHLIQINLFWTLKALFRLNIQFFRINNFYFIFKTISNLSCFNALQLEVDGYSSVLRDRDGVCQPLYDANDGREDYVPLYHRLKHGLDTDLDEFSSWGRKVDIAFLLPTDNLEKIFLNNLIDFYFKILFWLGQVFPSNREILNDVKK